MKTYTVCHRSLGYIAHNYINAYCDKSAKIKAETKYTNIINVMLLNRK